MENPPHLYSPNLSPHLKRWKSNILFEVHIQSNTDKKIEKYRRAKGISYPDVAFPSTIVHNGSEQVSLKSSSRKHRPPLRAIACSILRLILLLYDDSHISAFWSCIKILIFHTPLACKRAGLRIWQSLHISWRELCAAIQPSSRIRSIVSKRNHSRIAHPAILP